MDSIEFLDKVSAANQKVSYNDLRRNFLKYPITKVRRLDNLDAVLTNKEISYFTNAKDLIFFIETKSRQLDVVSAITKRAVAKKRNEQFLKEAQKTKEENDQLFFSIMESQGLMGSKNTSECVGCGIVVAANAQCRC